MKKQHDKFYDSPKWHRIKESVMKRDKYQDQESKRYSLIPKEAELVHHIFPREYFPEYQYEKWNLISLSKSTHNSLHNRYDDTLTDKGFELLRRAARANNIDLKLMYDRLVKAYPSLERNVENPPR